MIWGYHYFRKHPYIQIHLYWWIVFHTSFKPVTISRGFCSRSYTEVVNYVSTAQFEKQHVIYLPAFFWECKYLIFRATVVFVLVPHCEINQPAASTSCSVMTASTFIWCLLLRYLVIISTQNSNRTQISEEDPNQKSNPFSLFFLCVISSSCHRCLTF